MDPLPALPETPRIRLALLLGLAVGARLIAWYFTHDAPFVSDEADFFAAARNLALNGEPSFFRPPVTSLIASVVVYHGGSLAVTRLVWSVLGAVNVWLLYVLLSRFLERPVPFAASVLYALYLPAISYSTFVTSETPAVFFFLLAACLVTFPGRSVRLWRCVGAGVAGGLMLLTRTSLAALVPVIALFAAPASRGGKGRSAKLLSVAVILIMSAAPAAAWLLTVYSAHGKLFIAENTAYNLYLGNNPVYQEDLNLFNPLPTQEQIAGRKGLLLGGGGSLNAMPADYDARMRSALIFIEENPPLFLRRALGRLARIFVPKTSTLQLLGGERTSPWFSPASLAVLAATNLPYAAMLFFGWAGVILCGKSDPDRRFRDFALWVIVGSSILCLVAISKPRYSFPFDPFLGAGLCWLIYHRHELRQWVDTRSAAAIGAGWIFFAWSWIAWLIFAFASRSAVYG